MQSFGIRGLVAAFIAGLWLFSAGCKDDPKQVCCQCTCENENFSTPIQVFYTSGENLNCKKSCLTLCTQEKDFLRVTGADSVTCDAVPTDSGF